MSKNKATRHDVDVSMQLANRLEYVLDDNILPDNPGIEFNEDNKRHLKIFYATINHIWRALPGALKRTIWSYVQHEAENIPDKPADDWCLSVPDEFRWQNDDK